MANEAAKIQSWDEVAALRQPQAQRHSAAACSASLQVVLGREDVGGGGGGGVVDLEGGDLGIAVDTLMSDSLMTCAARASLRTVSTPATEHLLVVVGWM